MIDFPNSPTVGQISGSWQWDGTKWVTYGGVTGPTGAPNKLINPFMEIDQRNEGAAINQSKNNAYVVDGFVVQISVGAATWTIGRSNDAPPGYPNSIILTVTATGVLAAGSYSQLKALIEADELIDTGFGTSSARTVSVAFYAKSSIAGTYSAALGNSDDTQTYCFNFTLTAANTWQLVTQIIPGDTAGTWVTKGNSLGAVLHIVPAVGSTFQGAANAWQSGNILGTSSNTNTLFNTNGATFQLGPCGLWVAPNPQPLLRTSFQAELARCQRYVEKSYDLGTAPGTGTQNGCYMVGTPAAGSINTYAPAAFKMPKRATPTLTVYSGNTGASGKVAYWNNSAMADLTASISMTGLGSSSINAIVTSVAGGEMFFHILADASL